MLEIMDEGRGRDRRESVGHNRYEAAAWGGEAQRSDARNPQGDRLEDISVQLAFSR